MLKTWLYAPVKSLLQTANARTGNQDRFASHNVVLHVRISPPAQVGFPSLQRQSGAGELCSLDSRNNVLSTEVHCFARLPGYVGKVLMHSRPALGSRNAP